MTRLGSHSSRVLLWTGLLFLTLRPLGPVQAAVDVVVAPVRLLAELASPLALVRAAPVRAAEARLAEGAADEAEASRQLLADLARSALPTDPALLRARRVVHAEVQGRAAESRDRLRVRLRDVRGLAPGLPVACGDAYVGRLIEVRPSATDEGGTGVIELVTARGFHVGARVAAPLASGEPDVLMTVGGVAAGRGRRVAEEILLAVHNPSDRQVAEGLARVHELFVDAERYADLAEGLRLGSIRRDVERGRWAIVPELDYIDGLFQLVVLAPQDERLGSATPFEPVLMDSNWVRARPLGVGDPSPWRSATKVSVGRARGVRPGAAVVSIGARLVGRVLRAGPWTSDVSLLDDPGFQVVAVARVEGDPEPRVLGRLVSEGRDEDGAIRLLWIVRVNLEGNGERPARLFTGSGDPGLPAGFLLGETHLPLDARPGELRALRFEADVEPADVRSLFVRTVEAGP